MSDLANSFLNDAVMIDLSPEEITVERIEQSVMFVEKQYKINLIIDIINENIIIML